MPNDQSLHQSGLKPLRDLALGLSISVILLHCYGYCYPLFAHWTLTTAVTDRLILNFYKAVWIKSYWISKTVALSALGLAQIGAIPKDGKTSHIIKTVIFFITGITLYYCCYFALHFLDDPLMGYGLYMTCSFFGWLLIFGSFSIFAKFLAGKFSHSKDVFNSRNESFPQEERLVANEYSINLPTDYNLRGTKKNGWINIINPFRGLLVMGTPGSGKTHFIIRHVIGQHIQKGFSMFIYDFKYPDLTQLAFHYFQVYQKNYRVCPHFYVIDLEEISHRCNPVDPRSLRDMTDAAESARTILLALNPAWISKQGDFWVESAINFLTAVLWWLRLYEGGKYCSLPHVIELVQTPYEKLFSILRAEPQVETLVQPFVTAFVNNAAAQLEGQIAGTTISLGKLASPALYYVLSGNDLTLDINDPENPKIVCIGNRPQKAGIYGAVLSLYFTELTRQLNQKNRMKSSLILDELPSIYCHGIDRLVATARSNLVATTLAVQDASQLRLHYGRGQADVITGIVGNIISGQVSGETARQLSERFGRILQDKEPVSVHKNDQSVTSSAQLDMAIPPSTIAALSSGEFVGMVADDPETPIKLKKFHARVSAAKLKKQDCFSGWSGLPRKNVDPQTIMENYHLIKKDVRAATASEMERILNDPALKNLIVQKKEKN